MLPDRPSGLFALPPKEQALLSALLGLLLIDDLSLSEQNVLGNFLISIGTTILVAAAQGQLLTEYLEDVRQQRQTSSPQGQPEKAELSHTTG